MNKFTFKLPNLHGIKTIAIDFKNYTVIDVDPKFYIDMLRSNVIPKVILDQIEPNTSTLLNFNKQHIANVRKNEFGYSIEFFHFHSSEDERESFGGVILPARTHYTLSEFVHIVLFLDPDLSKHIVTDERYPKTEFGHHYQFTCFKGLVRIPGDKGLILYQVENTVVIGRELMLDFIQTLKPKTKPFGSYLPK